MITAKAPGKEAPDRPWRQAGKVPHVSGTYELGKWGGGSSRRGNSLVKA